jgi:hypothetical protein
LIHKGTTVFTNSSAEEPLPSLDVLGSFCASISSGKRVKKTIAKPESQRCISAEPGCDVQIMIRPGYAVTEYCSESGCVHISDSFMGHNEERGYCSIDAIAYDGKTGQRVAQASTLAISDRGLTGQNAVLNAVDQAVNDLAIRFGFQSGKASTLSSGSAIQSQADRRAAKAEEATNRGNAVNPLENAFKKTKASFSKLQDQLREMNKNNWQRIMGSLSSKQGT